MKALLTILWAIGFIALVLATPIIGGMAVIMLVLWFCIVGKILELFLWEPLKGARFLQDINEYIQRRMFLYRKKFYIIRNRYRKDFVTVYLSSIIEFAEFDKKYVEFVFNVNYNYIINE